MKFAIIETDNLGGDYPNESFTIKGLHNKEIAEQIADLIYKDKSRGIVKSQISRFWKVEEDCFDKPYKLQPGFES